MAFYFFAALAVFLNIPAATCLLDMFSWFFVNETFSGIIYGANARPLVALTGTILSIPTMFIAVNKG